MSDQPVLFSRAAASCRLTLNREDKCHAINEEMIESLDHYLNEIENDTTLRLVCLLYTSPSPRDRQKSRMPSSA